jgi:acetyl esterase/lipase
MSVFRRYLSRGCLLGLILGQGIYVHAQDAPGQPPLNLQNLRLVHEQAIPLWGDKPAPDTEGVTLEEKWTEFGNNPQVPDRSVTNISSPSITAFTPAQPNGAAMIVLPGGGYNKVVFDKEGVNIARWLNSIGITAFVLKYRLPAEWPDVGYNMPFQDAQRALRLVRANAQHWGLDGNRIGVIGFSAGGNLAANLGTVWNKKTHKPVDVIDQQNARPDLMVLVYASFDNLAPHFLYVFRSWSSSNQYLAMARHFEPIAQVTADTSPAFILAAHNDSKVPASHSAKFYTALYEAKVSTELHIYRDGEHGFAISKTNGLPVANWTNQCVVWFKQMAFIKE